MAVTNAMSSNGTWGIVTTADNPVVLMSLSYRNLSSGSKVNAALPQRLLDVIVGGRWVRVNICSSLVDTAAFSAQGSRIVGM
jgi:hypothetical protein